MPKPEITAYIRRFPPGVQKRLRLIRARLRALVPDATETLSYGIPTFQVGGKNLIHFAAFANHIGLYPGPDAMAHFKSQMRRFATSKGALQVTHTHALPVGLISRLVKYRLDAQRLATPVLRRAPRNRPASAKVRKTRSRQ